jgi:hypothetical protein
MAETHVLVGHSQVADAIKQNDGPLVGCKVLIPWAHGSATAGGGGGGCSRGLPSAAGCPCCC